MWSDDRRYHELSLRKIQDDLKQLEEGLALSARELADDDYDGTEDTRARVREARAHLRLAAGSVERALEQLPEGKQRPSLSTKGETA